MLIRKRFDVIGESIGFSCNSPSRTQQQFKDECDVNNILRNYVSTGVLTHTSDKEIFFADVSAAPSDYYEARKLLNDSKVAFDQLPSYVRERFDNNPYNVVKFLSDEKNYDEAVKLGLCKVRENKTEN